MPSPNSFLTDGLSSSPSPIGRGTSWITRQSRKTWVRVIVLILMVCFLSLSAGAWRINEELKKETTQYKSAVEATPNDPLAHFNLAITYAYTNKLFTGWDELKKVNELDPEFKEKGYRLFIKKVNASPSDWRLRFRLAFAYYFNGMKKDAIRELKNVLILDPYNVWAYGYISLIYGELGDTDNAIKWVKKGLKIDSNVAALHLLLSEGLAREGDNWGAWGERMEALRLRAIGY